MRCLARPPARWRRTLSWTKSLRPPPPSLTAPALVSAVSWWFVLLSIARLPRGDVVGFSSLDGATLITPPASMNWFVEASRRRQLRGTRRPRWRAPRCETSPTLKCQRSASDCQRAFPPYPLKVRCLDVSIETVAASSFCFCVVRQRCDLGQLVLERVSLGGPLLLDGVPRAGFRSRHPTVGKASACSSVLVGSWSRGCCGFFSHAVPFGIGARNRARCHLVRG